MFEPSTKEKQLGNLIVTEYITLDGVVESPGGGEAFEHGGWTFRIDRGDEGNAFKFEESRDTAALLFGRTTYEGMAAVWPHMTGEFADMWNSMPKYVVSSTLTNPEWNNTSVLSGDVAGEVKRLVDETEGNVVIHGSPTLVNELLSHELVDELRLMTFPTVLGSGRRLFSPAETPSNWRLEEVRSVGDGIVITIYRPLFSYRVSRDMRADVATVWKAWTDPDDYAEWFHGVPGSVELDVRQGGAWKVAIGGEEGSKPEEMSGRYEEVVSEEKLVMTTYFPGGDTVMEMQFEPSNRGTRVTISQTSDSRGERDGGREGSEILLQSCADFLSRKSRS